MSNKEANIIYYSIQEIRIKWQWESHKSKQFIIEKVSYIICWKVISFFLYSCTG